MRKIIFIKDFATKKKGDTWECDSLLASSLVHQDKVAEYFTDKQKETKKAK